MKDFSTMQIQLFILKLKYELSINDDKIGDVFRHNYHREVDLIDTFEELRKALINNKNLQNKLNKIKEKKRKSLTYKTILRDSLGNTDFSIDNVIHNLKRSSANERTIYNFLTKTSNQLETLIKHYESNIKYD